LSSAVEHLMESPDTLRAAGAVSRGRAHHFAIERMIDRLASLYRNAVDDAA